MDIDEAIDILDDLIGMITTSNGKDVDEALKMAIQALKDKERNE